MCVESLPPPQPLIVWPQVFGVGGSADSHPLPFTPSGQWLLEFENFDCPLFFEPKIMNHLAEEVRSKPCRPAYMREHQISTVSGPIHMPHPKGLNCWFNAPTKAFPYEVLVGTPLDLPPTLAV